MDQQREQPGPTIAELIQGFREGGDEKVSQMLTVNRKRLIPSPKDLFLAHRDGGKPMLAALLSHMDGLESENEDPEWNERRWAQSE
jgi:hypothetical protein